MNIEPGTTLFRGSSFLQLQDLQFVNGAPIGGKAGVRVPLPSSSMPDGYLTQVNVLPQELYENAIAAPLPYASLSKVVLTVGRLGGGFLFENMPLTRLVVAKQFCRYPILFEPCRVDARNSWLVITDDTLAKFRTALEFIYV